MDFCGSLGIFPKKLNLRFNGRRSCAKIVTLQKGRFGHIRLIV
jgi:hypothetical protein